MTSKRDVDWIHIIKPDDENKIANPSHIRELLDIKTIGETLGDVKLLLLSIENRLTVLEKPLRKEAILKLLSEETKPHTEHWITNRRGNYLDILELKNEGKLVVTISPKSHKKMYSIARKKAKKCQIEN